MTARDENWDFKTHPYVKHLEAEVERLSAGRPEVEPEPTYEYRVFEKQYGKRMPFRDHPQPTTDVLKTAESWRRGADFIPKSGSWHIERREVGEWEEIPNPRYSS